MLWEHTLGEFLRSDTRFLLDFNFQGSVSFVEPRQLHALWNTLDAELSHLNWLRIPKPIHLFGGALATITASGYLVKHFIAISKHDWQLLFYSNSEPWIMWNFWSCLSLKKTCLCNASLLHLQWFPTSSCSMIYQEISSLFEIPSRPIVF